MLALPASERSCPEEPFDFRAGPGPPRRPAPGHQAGSPLPTRAGPALPAAGAAGAARRALPYRTSPLGAGGCLPRHARPRVGTRGPDRRGTPLTVPPGRVAALAPGRAGSERKKAAGSGGTGQDGTAAAGSPLPGTACAPADGASPPGARAFTGEEAPLPGRGGELPRREDGQQPPEGAGGEGQRPALPAGLRRWSRSRDVPGSRCCLWRRCRSSRGSPGTWSEAGPGEPRPRLPAPTPAAPSPSPRPLLPSDLFGSSLCPPNARRGRRKKKRKKKKALEGERGEKRF